jgi:hypothetical protein
MPFRNPLLGGADVLVISSHYYPWYGGSITARSRIKRLLPRHPNPRYTVLAYTVNLTINATSSHLECIQHTPCAHLKMRKEKKRIGCMSTVLLHLRASRPKAFQAITLQSCSIFQCIEQMIVIVQAIYKHSKTCSVKLWFQGEIQGRITKMGLSTAFDHYYSLQPCHQWCCH